MTRVKLLNLRVGAKPATDDVVLSTIAKFPKQVMMMGQRESQIEAHATAEALASSSAPKLEDDFELDTRTTTAAMANPDFLAKLDRRVRNCKFPKQLSEPRLGAKCLVLDIDYTLFDHRTTAENPSEIMRPYLHEFLTRAYRANFDILIWSATSLKWIELKMTELGVLTHSDYKIVGLIDSSAMITVETVKYGVFNCKPLGYLFAQEWAHYDSTNTLMFDDLSRNFIMNPQLGLKIRPFRNAHTSRATDRELLRLSEYIEEIAALDDFSSLNHNRWESFLATKKHRRHD
jgi:ubiquitin-like domain-containing CTD phosphatase 1